MKHYLSILGLVFSVSCLAQPTYRGIISDSNSGESLLFANISVYNDDHIISGTESNITGEFEFTISDPFTHIEVQYIGYESKRILKEDLQSTFNDISVDQNVLDEIVIIAYAPKITDCCWWGCGSTITCQDCLNDKLIPSNVWRDKKPSREEEGLDNWIYPNPTSGISNIDHLITDRFTHYRLYNTIGQALITNANLTSKIDLSNIPDGNYTLVAFNEQEIKTTQVIKIE